MNKFGIGVIGFIVGGGLGGLIATRLLSARFDTEIESVRKSFDTLRKKREKTEAPNEPAKPRADRAEKPEDKRAGRVEYARKVNRLKYNPEADAPAYPEPRIISINEAGGQSDEYEVASLTYFTDGVLIGEDERPIDKKDIPELLGENNLAGIKSGEVDSVYIRNERLKCDYEVIADEISYADYIKERPYLAK